MIPHFGLVDHLQPYVTLGLYLGTIPVFLLSIFWRPIAGLFYVVPLLPLQIIRFHMHTYPLGKHFVDIILLGVIIGLVSRGQFSILRNPMGAILAAVAVYTYLSLWMATLFGDFPLPFWITDERVSRWKNHVIVPLVVFLCVLAAVRTMKEIKAFVLVMSMTLAAMVVQQYNNARYHTYSEYDDNQRAEAYENGLGSNELGALEAEFCLFVLGLRALEKKRAVRWACSAVGIMAAYCVMASFSRGAYAAALVGWAFLGIVKERALGVCLIVFLLSWEFVVPNAVRERILMTYDKSTGELESSAASRVTMWEDALEAFEKEPVFGTGYDTYRYLSRIGWHDCHNFYVKVIFELGIVGLAGFLFLGWKLYHIGYRLFRTASDPFLASLGLGFAAWMVCAMAANFFGDRWNYVQITGYTFAIAGCVVRGLMMTAEATEAAEAREGELVPA